MFTFVTSGYKSKEEVKFV